MFKVNKQISLDIVIDQHGVEELIRNKIAEEDPSIVVTKIQFVQKRKPTNTLEVVVDAHIQGQTPAAPKPIQEPEDEDTEADEPEEVEQEEPTKPTVGSLFND